MTRSRYHDAILKTIGDKHMTVDDLYDALKKKYNRIGIATVYRNVDILLDEGLLVKIAGVFDKTYFEKDKGPHLHLIDRKKEEFVDIFLPHRDWISLPEGFEPEEIQFNIIGQVANGSVKELAEDIHIAVGGNSIDQKAAGIQKEEQLEEAIDLSNDVEAIDEKLNEESVSKINEKPEVENQQDTSFLEKVFRGF